MARIWCQLALVIVTFTVAAPAVQAQTASPSLSIDDLENGGFAFRNDDGSLALAPLLTSEASYSIDGILARATITQQFINPHDEWQEGIYLFPLPETAAVDTLTMHIGDRVIEGRIERREEARVQYEAAAEAGQQASLVEQERPNMFTASVANIAPGALIRIEIAFQHAVDVRDGSYSLRLPLVVGPRFTPEPSAALLVSNNPAEPEHAAAVDADRVMAPVLNPADGLINLVHLTLNLAPGFPLSAIESSSHPLDITDNRDGSYSITITDGVIPANKDFELVWSPAPEASPHITLYREQIGDQTYILGLITPPVTDQANAPPRMPREVIFVIDTSGSMSGESIRQARSALLMALQRLHNDDRFNIIRFASDHAALFDSPVAADPDNLLIAMDFAASLDSGGGTNMLPALQTALADEPPARYLKQIIFITDGSVSNESRLFAEVSQNLGNARLFTVGIGSAPNGYFMRKAAEFGRGTFTIIDSVGEVEERMAELFLSLEQPKITNLEMFWPDGSNVALYPDPLPDLYSGEPLIFTARVEGPAGESLIQGDILGQMWSTEISIDQARPTEGVARLWAQAQIDDLEDAIIEGHDRASTKKTITEVALQFGLLTDQTSLVAIDVTPVRSPDQMLMQRQLPLNLPEGWDYEAVFSPTDSPQAMPTTLLQTVSLDMPSGATASELLIFIGLLLLSVAAVLALLPRAATQQKPA
jgi:Ca-activated chloride channel family protein